MERGPIELAGGEVHADARDLHPALTLQRAPGGDVRVVIEIGDDDLIAGAPAAPEGARQMEDARRHVVREGDLARGGIEEVGDRGARGQEHRIGLIGGGVRPMGVRVVMQQIVAHRIDDRLRDLRAPRPIEVGDGVAVVLALQRGEARADLCGGGGHWRAHWITVPVSCSTHFTTST